MDIFKDDKEKEKAKKGAAAAEGAKGGSGEEPKVGAMQPGDYIVHVHL
jgi:hypothetical protein